MRRIPTIAKVAGIALVAFAFVPASRGPLVCAAAIALLVQELRARRHEVGKAIDISIDGARHRLPPGGGSVLVGGREVPVERVGGFVVVDGRRLARGEGFFEGSSHVEVVR